MYRWIKLVLFSSDGPDKPTISQDPSRIPSAGENIMLTCGADAYPTPEDFITWYKNDDKLEGIPVDNYSTLNLVSVTKEDSGVYRCEANNHIGHQTSDLYNLTIQCEYFKLYIFTSYANTKYLYKATQLFFRQNSSSAVNSVRNRNKVSPKANSS